MPIFGDSDEEEDNQFGKTNPKARPPSIAQPLKKAEARKRNTFDSDSGSDDFERKKAPIPPNKTALPNSGSKQGKQMAPPLPATSNANKE